MDRVSAGIDDEAHLLARARGGDRFAFGEVVRLYQRRVYGVARRILRRHDLADDVTQETFLRAFERLGSYDDARPFGPWICRIAANLAISLVRSPRFREEEFASGDGETPGAGAGPLERVLEEERESAVAAAVANLPEDQRAVLVLRAVEELSYAEIAEALGIPEGTVMSRLSRARSRLAVALAPLLGPRRERERAGATS
jgi:RNA polymerase sigma-70 factor, ECF subfamily